MRSKSPELMKEICTFVSDYYRDRRSSPSVSAIAKAVGIAKTTAYRYLVDMNERGMISYDGHTILFYPQERKHIYHLLQSTSLRYFLPLLFASKPRFISFFHPKKADAL